MIAIALKAFFLIGALSWYSAAIFSMINDYFRNEFNDYMKKIPNHLDKSGSAKQRSIADNTPTKIDGAIIESAFTIASTVIDDAAVASNPTKHDNNLGSIYDNNNENELNSPFYIKYNHHVVDNTNNNNKNLNSNANANANYNANNYVQSTGMVNVHCAQNECCYIHPIDFLSKTVQDNMCFENG